MRNALHIPRLKHNLIPPLIMREAGLTLSKVPRIHCEEPTMKDNSIYDDTTKLQIPLKLDAILLYFLMRALTLE